MKTQFAAPICMLIVAACGGSDRSAQDPSSQAAYTPVVATSPGVQVDVQPSMATAPPLGAADTMAANRMQDAGRVELTPNQGTNKTDVGVTNPAPSEPGPAADTSDHRNDATNTRINKRDRNGTLTPIDQGGSEGDRKITAAIRRGVVGDKSLSFTAKNVKIITVGGKVTLRGPVKNADEKARIEAVARQTDGVAEVDNQLETKN